jgi:hypothetical protein
MPERHSPVSCVRPVSSALVADVHIHDSRPLYQYASNEANLPLRLTAVSMLSAGCLPTYSMRFRRVGLPFLAAALTPTPPHPARYAHAPSTQTVTGGLILLLVFPRRRVLLCFPNLQPCPSHSTSSDAPSNNTTTARLHHARAAASIGWETVDSPSKQSPRRVVLESGRLASAASRQHLWQPSSTLAFLLAGWSTTG